MAVRIGGDEGITEIERHRLLDNFYPQLTPLLTKHVYLLRLLAQKTNLTAATGSRCGRFYGMLRPHRQFEAVVQYKQREGG
ncbi:hypothetical protein D3C80_2112810 [compost metagenome]